MKSIQSAWAMLIGLFLLVAATARGDDGGRQALTQWRAGEAVTAADVAAFGIERCFAVEEISDALMERMQGRSFRQNPHIKRGDLRYVRALHYDAEGRIRIGEMVCNSAIAQDLVEIFRELYRARYPIGRMVLIDEYDADDERSMRANNSSCFCYRPIAGSSKLSLHAQGRAVDINTLYNPYVRRRADGTLFVQPATGRKYVDRTKSFPYKIEQGDLCHRLFTQHGFRWGGAWKRTKDYQHFEK